MSKVAWASDQNDSAKTETILDGGTPIRRRRPTPKVSLATPIAVHPLRFPLPTDVFTTHEAPAALCRRLFADPARHRGGGFRPRSAARPFGKLLRLPRTGRRQAQGRTAARHEGGRVRKRRIGRGRNCAGQARTERN